MEKLKIDFDYKLVSEFAKALPTKSIIIANGMQKADSVGENFQIIIGGFKLSRGITYSRLTHEVMVNMGNEINAISKLPCSSI